MQTWVIQEDTGTDQIPLQLEARACPSPSGSDVRIRVAAVGINRADLLQVKGRYPPPPGFDPGVPGLEYAGVIDAVGERVTERQVGEPVMGLVPGGAYSEYLLTTEPETIPVPPGIGMAEAAAIPEAFLTAYRALVIEGSLATGDDVLIRPVTAGVGLAAARLASALGARVIGASRAADRLQQVRAAGVALRQAVVDDGNGIAPAVREYIGGVDLAVDMVAGAALNDSLACLNTEGRVVMIGLLGGLNAEVDLGSLLMRRGGLKAMTMRAQPLEERIRHARLFREQLAPLFADDRLRPDLARVFPFEQAPVAHQVMAGGEVPGKLVLTL